LDEYLIGFGGCSSSALTVIKDIPNCSCLLNGWVHTIRILSHFSVRVALLSSC